MNVVIATDGSPSSAAAVDWAARFLDPTEAVVHVISVVPLAAYLIPATPGIILPDDYFEQMRAAGFAAARRALDAARAKLKGAGLKATYLAREGEPASSIMDLARGTEAPLVIVGSGGKNAASRFFLGSVSEALLHSLPGAVLIIHAPPVPTAA